MKKGVSIFYDYHEQGYPHQIAGIYDPYDKTEEEMRTELLSLIGEREFTDRDQPTFINHTHLYAKSLLGEELDKDVEYVLKQFFPFAIDVQGFQSSAFKFMYYDGDAYEFIWNNRYHKQLHQHRLDLQHEAAAAYKAKRDAAKRGE
jgi:hypothetical protein